jgi:hypothetical protein
MQDLYGKGNVKGAIYFSIDMLRVFTFDLKVSGDTPTFFFWNGIYLLGRIINEVHFFR